MTTTEIITLTAVVLGAIGAKELLFSAVGKFLDRRKNTSELRGIDLHNTQNQLITLQKAVQDVGDLTVKITGYEQTIAKLERSKIADSNTIQFQAGQLEENRTQRDALFQSVIEFKEREAQYLLHQNECEKKIAELDKRVAELESKNEELLRQNFQAAGEIESQERKADAQDEAG
jgi:chromosome segregation ATPase